MATFVMQGAITSWLTSRRHPMKKVKQATGPEVPEGPKMPEVPQHPTIVPEVPEVTNSDLTEQIEKHNKAADHNEALAERHREAAKELAAEGDASQGDPARAQELHVIPPTYNPSDNQQHPAM